MTEDLTVGEVFDAMDDQQKVVVYYLVGKAIGSRAKSVDGFMRYQCRKIALAAQKESRAMLAILGSFTDVEMTVVLFLVEKALGSGFKGCSA